jgi:methylmalonyl-CoA mutase
MGDPKMRTIRSDFAFNLFACGGFDVFARPFETADEVAASPADMIVLCSSDAEYPALASAVVSKQLDLGQETPVMIAGSPDSVEQLRASGIAGFIHSKSDPVDILTRWQQHFGIRE